MAGAGTRPGERRYGAAGRKWGGRPTFLTKTTACGAGPPPDRPAGRRKTAARSNLLPGRGLALARSACGAPRAPPGGFRGIQVLACLSNEHLNSTFTLVLRELWHFLSSGPDSQKNHKSLGFPSPFSSAISPAPFSQCDFAFPCAFRAPADFSRAIPTHTAQYREYVCGSHT